MSNWGGGRIPIAPGLNKPGKVNTSSYLVRSLERIAVMADRPFSMSKAVVCQMIREYGHSLPDAQREALEKWCQGK